MILLFRSFIFTLLVPGSVAGLIPYLLYESSRAEFDIGPLRFLGITCFLLGLPIFFECVIAFLFKGGTPAIWFTSPIRFLWGEEPGKLVSDGIYARSRNPMYLGVLLLVFGEALFFQRYALMVYAITMFLFFHIVVVYVEEPHLKEKYGSEYKEYLAQIPRWFGRKS